MTRLVVHSARISYGGPDRLDVTRKSGTDGLFLAPSWALLQPILKARKQVRDQLARGLHPGDELERRTWASYVEGYLAEMRESYVQYRWAWDDLLARPRVVLVCYCTVPDHCHRFLLRTRILPALGAVDGGELLQEAASAPLFEART